MINRISALKALGLRSGAGRSEIEEAYRRLIKIHHPDRTGGDGGRAAEINTAYTLLRRDSLPAVRQVRQVPIPVPERSPPRRRTGLLSTLVIFALLCGTVAGVAAMAERNFDRRIAAIRLAALDPGQVREDVLPVASFDAPLNGEVIDNAISDALKFRAANDMDGASTYSRDCQENLRAHQNLTWFDACAAFDESLATLGDEDPALQNGRFGDSALMTREFSAGRILSDDSLGADGRLHQIRSQVEMKLLPIMDAAAGQKL